ncbi:GtrA family protein [Legionella sp. CNM-4043-24]|uniref:GtrA family protein n=1 Tax=Legionella sp. CNM-4043-24 TaxID=3421646 RepID=UPI00403B0884
MTALIGLINRFSSYLAVGAINTLLCFLLMYLGHLWGMNYLYYTAFGYLFTIAFSFFMNLRFTFQVEGQLMKRLTLFAAIGVFNLLLVEYIEFTLVERFDSGKIFAIVCGMTWNVLAGFLASNFLVYRRTPEVSS